MDEFRHTLSRSLGMVFLLTIPSSVGLVVLGQSMIGAIFQGGKFQLHDTQETALALSCYAIGLTGYSALKILNPAFYALRDARTPMWISIFSIAINFGMATILLKFTHLSHAGLALSTSTVAIFGAVALFWILRNRIAGIQGRLLFGSFWKITVASALMGCCAAASSHWIGVWLGAGTLARLTDLAISMPTGVLVFYGACRLLKIRELDVATKSLLAPLGRWLTRTR